MCRGCFVVLTLLAVGFDAVGAQEPTASAGAEECMVEPYDLTTALQPADETPVAEPTVDLAPTERPSGEPADEETVAGVAETVELFVGCLNLGYGFSVLFLLTREYVSVYVLERAGPLTADEIAELAELAAHPGEAEPIPPDEQIVILAIEDVEVLDDGRVVATVIADDLSRDGGPSPVYFVLEEVHGRFLIDGVIDPEPEGTPGA